MNLLISKTNTFIVNLFIFISTLFTFIFYKHNFPHNTVANILPGIAPHLNLGVPYLDYWDVYPPGIYLFYFIFFIFGRDTFISYQLLHVGLLLIVLYLFFSFSKLFKISIIYFLIACYYFLSPLYVYYLLPNELIGLAFSFSGIYILTMANKKYNYFFGNFLLLFAVFIKELYFLPYLITYLIILTSNKKVKYESMLGQFVCLLIIFSYSVYFNFYNEMVSNYFDKIKLYKNNIIYLFIFLLFVLIIFSSLTLFKKSILFEINKFIEVKKYLLIYSILILISYRLINFDDGGHWDIAKSIPFFICLFFIIEKLNNNKIFNFIFVIILSTYFLLGQHVATSYLNNLKNLSNLSLQNPKEETKLELVNSNYQHLYGWDSPLFYYKYKIKPPNKYWILHPQILNLKQIELAKSFFLEQPPVYLEICSNFTNCDTGFSVEDFEKNYLKIEQIIKSCFSVYDINIYKLNELSCLNNFK